MANWITNLCNYVRWFVRGLQSSVRRPELYVQDKSVQPERGGHTDERAIDAADKGERANSDESEFYRQSPFAAAKVVQQILEGRERYAEVTGQSRNAQKVDLRITFEDGGYYIHTAIPKINHGCTGACSQCDRCSS